MVGRGTGVGELGAGVSGHWSGYVVRRGTGVGELGTGVSGHRAGYVVGRGAGRANRGQELVVIGQDTWWEGGQGVANFGGNWSGVEIQGENESGVGSLV